MVLRVARCGRPADGVAADEASHFIPCPVCGKRVDMRDLAALLRHLHDERVPFIWRGEEPKQ